MRILLVNPPIPLEYYNREFYLPSSLLYMGAVLQKNGEDVRVLDLKPFSAKGILDPYKFYDQTLINAVSEFKPDLIGFGCLYSGSFPDVLRFSALVKKEFGNIPVMAGGIHFTIYASQILDKCPSIDWIVLGEGEEAVIQVVNAVKNKSRGFDNIDGFAFRKNGKGVVNPKTRYIEDLDTVPFPAYNLIDIKDYYVDTSNWHNPKKLAINTSVPIITSRSCPNRCNFCSMFMAMGPKWRARSPENVAGEIEFVHEKYGHSHFSFMDDNMSLDKKRVLGICAEIKKRRLDIQFETPNGLAINTLDEEVLDALVSAGMVRTWLAIESGSDYIRNKIMRKNLSRRKIYDVARLIRKYKQLNVAAFFIIGMPEDTKETLMETYDMIKEIDVDRVFVQNVVPFPGTEVFRQALKDNLLVDGKVDEFYLRTDRYLTNYDQIFIKPYKLELNDLREFRMKCEELPSVKRPRERQGVCL